MELEVLTRDGHVRVSDGEWAMILPEDAYNAYVEGGVLEIIFLKAKAGEL